MLVYPTQLYTRRDNGLILLCHIIGRAERALLVDQMALWQVRQSTAHAPCSRNMVQRLLD